MDTHERMDVGAMVTELRVEAHLSQKQLADRLGTAQSAVSRWERGHDEPRLRTLFAIATACGKRLVVDIDEDVDRAQIRQQLQMTPLERLASVVNVSRMRAMARTADAPSA